MNHKENLTMKKSVMKKKRQRLQMVCGNVFYTVLAFTAFTMTIYLNLVSCSLINGYYYLESDSDYELDQWNADDEAKQEEENNDQDDEPAQNDFIDAEADEDDDDDSNAVEYNSGCDGDISDEGDNDDENSVFSDKEKTKQQKHHRYKKHKKANGTQPSEEQKTDINSNSQSISDDSQGNTDNRPSLCLRLDSIDDDYESPDDFTKMKCFKSPEASLSLQLASDLTNDSSNIEPGQGEGWRNFSRQESDSEVSSMLPPIVIRSNSKENTQKKPKKVSFRQKVLIFQKIVLW